MERAVYRIIDANFNRAREAVRVIEEYCRFALNSGPLAARAKQLRHELSAAIDKLDPGRLIASRDTIGDVGVETTVDNQLGRGDIKDCLTAACKRLGEALRALAEMVQTIDAGHARAAEKFKRVRLCVIISSNLPVEVITLSHRCIAGGADCLQLRSRDVTDDKLFALAGAFVEICRADGVVSIINDRSDIAVAAGADGVHLGQHDLPIEQARKLQLAPLVIGKSTHSLEQLHAACDELPTYVGLGPVFATATKPGVEVAGLDYVKEATEALADTGIAHVALGGITLNNVEEVLSAGARAVAVCSAVAQASDPIAACRALKEKVVDFKGH
ncbi:MAG: thiamine phosphate synthase [Planctomycetota bacterium]|jgi:thiamine-phosphate pyrophosphorylase